MAGRKVAVVTGASRGIGAQLAQVLAEEGYALALGARDFEALRSMANELPSEVLPCFLDVTDGHSVQKFQEECFRNFGRVDLLINNAGIGIFQRLDEISTQDFRKLFAVNVQGAFSVTRAFLPSLNDSEGTVIMMSSDVSTRVFERGGAYCATKFALRALARTLQIENPSLRVMELRPGATDTWFAGSVPGAPGKEWFLKAQELAELVRALLRLPASVRVEELVVRSKGQPPEY